MSFELEEFQAEVMSAVNNTLNEFVEGTTEEIGGLSIEIAKWVSDASLIRDDIRRADVVEELWAQTLLLPEIARLQASNASWDIAIKILRVTVSTIVGVSSKALNIDPRIE